MQSSGHQSHCCHTIAASQQLYDLNRMNAKFSRRTVNVAVRQRVVTRTGVRTLVTEVKKRGESFHEFRAFTSTFKNGAALIPDTKPGKGNCNAGRNTKGHEEKSLTRIQHDALGFRDVRKIAIGVQRSKQTDQDEDCGNSSKFMETSHLASASWSFGRSSPSLWEFTEWANSNGRRLVEDNEVDGALVNNMNDSFFAGVQAHVGERLMAELMSEVPEFSKTGRRTTPRVWRCLRGWRRLCPSRSRRPYPLPAWAAMANELTRQEYRLVAVALLLGLQTYLRPGGLVQLHKVDLIGAKKGVFWTAGT